MPWETFSVRTQVGSRARSIKTLVNTKPDKILLQSSGVHVLRIFVNNTSLILVSLSLTHTQSKMLLGLNRVRHYLIYRRKKNILIGKC